MEKPVWKDTYYMILLIWHFWKRQSYRNNKQISGCWRSGAVGGVGGIE